MRTIISKRLWIGHAGDARDEGALRESDICAVVDLAYEEPPPVISRDLIVCRIPLSDDGENDPERLATAVDLIVSLLERSIPVLVACSGGMSRSPAISAAAIARVQNLNSSDALRMVTQDGPADVSPMLWQQLIRL